jgi:hypothetical protein
MKYFVALILISVLVLVKILQSIIFNKETQNVYAKKKFLTDNEIFFYNCLKDLNPEYVIIPQVSLASIIKKVNYHKYQNELYRIIDFGIFDKSLNILLTIEINDSSHKARKRINRDYKVKEMLKEANIELLIFKTDCINTKESIIFKVNEALSNLNKNK